MLRDLERRRDAHAALLGGCQTEPAGERDRLHARGPDERSRGDHFAALQAHPSAVVVGDRGTEPRLHVLAPQRFRGGLTQPARHGGEQPIRGLEQQHSHVLEVETRVVLYQHQADQLGERTGHLDPRGAAPDHDEGQLRAALLRIGLQHGALEGVQHVVPDTDRLGDVLEAEAVLRHAFEAEIVRLTPDSEDQVVVRDRTVGRHDAIRGRLEAGDLGHAELGVGLASQNGADRAGDLLGLEPRGGDLVEQRLEQMVVVAVHQHHVDRRLTQCARRAQPAESGSDDDDARSGRALGRHLNRVRPAAEAGGGGGAGSGSGFAHRACSGLLPER